MPKYKKSIIVYTDGSCSGNGKNGAVGGIGVHFPNGELKDISKIFTQGYCTNQRTELYAILTALRYLKKKLGLRNYHVIIKTDSQYSIDCITKWIYGWTKNGWKTKIGTDVANKELIQLIHQYYEAYDIVFEHVDAHTRGTDSDSIANDKADKLAQQATKKALSKKKTKKKTKSEDSDSTESDNPTPRKAKVKPLVRLEKVKPMKHNYSHEFGWPASNDFIVELVKHR